MSNVNYIVAFTNGLISFFTPCILPLLPVYFGYLAGETISNIQENNKLKKRLIINAIGFVLGLTILNILLGFGAKAAISILRTYAKYIRIGGGILLILFGTYFISNINLKILEKERKFHYTNYSSNFLKSFFLGIAFSFGWTPCNGPIIASILMMAGFQQNYLKAGTLMLTYSLGFAIMFIMFAVLAGKYIHRIKSIYKYFRHIKIFAGTIMIIMGILLIIDKISIINGLG